MRKNALMASASILTFVLIFLISCSEEVKSKTNFIFKPAPSKGIVAQINGLKVTEADLFKGIENEIYGAAHVVAWIGFMDYLGDQLTDYGIKEVIAKKDNLSKLNIENIDDLREIVTDYAIIIMLREIKIFSKLEMTSIHGLLSKRNECAHPTNYRPGLSETLGYVNELLKRIKEIESKKAT